MTAMFKAGNKVEIISIENTRRYCGLHEQMQKLFKKQQPVIIESVGIHSNRVRIQGFNWHIDDLILVDVPKEQMKHYKYLKKIRAIEQRKPKKVPAYFKEADSINSFEYGKHDNNFAVYNNKDFPDCLDVRFQLLVDDNTDRVVTHTVKSCFGSLPDCFSFRHGIKFPNRVMYKLNFKNSYYSSKDWLSPKEIRKWMNLCKTYKCIPKHINIKRFIDHREFVINISSINIDHLFFYLVNARYCDETPLIPRLTMFFMDKANVSFYIAYVLAHFSIIEYDEEHGALPRDENEYVRRLEKTTRYRDDWGEDITVYVHFPPLPRNTILYATRVYRFVNFINVDPKILHPICDNTFWALFQTIMNTTNQIEIPLEINNKSYDVLSKTDVTAFKVNEKYKKGD